MSSLTEIPAVATVSISKVHWQESLSTVMSWTLACWIFLVPSRGFAMNYGWYWLNSPIKMGRSVISGAYLDLVYLGCVAAVFAIVLHFCHRSIVRRVVIGVLIGHCVVALVWGMANAQLVPLLGQPLNYVLLYSSGIFRAFGEPASLFTMISPAAALKLVGVLTAMAAIAVLFRIMFVSLLRRFGVALPAAALMLGIAYCIVSSAYQANFYRPMLQSPVVAFASSLLGEEQTSLFIMPTDLAVPELVIPTEKSTKPAASRAPTHPAVRNVLLIVLESVPAEALPAYGSGLNVTPELDFYRSATRQYDTFYAHSPSTNKSLFTYLCSLYPTPSYLTETIEYSDRRFDSLPAVLHSRGYRTGMFYSADLRYGDADRFLANRSFDVVKDARTLGSGVPNCIGNSGLPFSDGMDDGTLMNDVASWINDDPQRPFLAMLWTSQTHYPYFVMGDAKSPGWAALKDRYLTSLRETDAAMGKLFRSLEAAGRLESTLVVIVGDHGEAFGKHDQWGHGNGLYDENLRVPLLLINSHLFKGEHDASLGGGVDLAPTILDILGIEPSRMFQGRSMFGAERPARVYFMAPWSNWFGYREGDSKVLFKASSEKYEVYDLAKDPGEETNIAGQLSDSDKNLIQRRLAAWVQYQHKLLDGLGAGDPD